MNGPLKMYRIKPIVEQNIEMDLPKCMYKMKNIISGHKNESVEHVSSPKKNLDISEQKFQSHPDMEALQARQEILLKQLTELKEQLLTLQTTYNLTDTSNTAMNSSSETNIQSAVVISDEVKNITDLVINVGPSNPPYSLLVLQDKWANCLQLVVRNYLHSSVTDLPEKVHKFIEAISKKDVNPGVPQILIRLIWKKVEGTMELRTSNSLHMPIHGESNILRYLSRIGPSNWNYEQNSNCCELDYVLDICYLISKSRTKTERQTLLTALNSKLGKFTWLCNSQEMSIADVAASSVIKQVCASDVNNNISKWLQRCEISS